MRKLIAKTIAFSLVILLVAVSAFYLILAVATPKTLGNFYFSTGSENLAIKYSERAYDKSGDISDLATLVERSASFKNHSLVKKYGLILLSDGDFEEFADANGSGYKYYIAGSVVQSLYALNEKQASIDVAFNSTANYSQVNPVRVLISIAIESLDNETISAVLSRLELRENKNENCQNDISKLRDYLK
jgi:hypothetical protein